MRGSRWIAIVVMSALLASVVGAAGPVVAQGDGAPERVEVTGTDGWTLVGEYYAPSADAVGETGAPAIVALHQASSRKEAWMTVAPELVAAGYAVLAIDQRGHGETRGKLSLAQGEDDLRVWCAWLREQPGIDPERLNMMGGSMGANFALAGMGNDERIVTAIALSPGMTGGYGIYDISDVFEQIGTRPVFIAASRRDEPSGPDVRVMLPEFAGEMQVLFYGRGAHGLGLFQIEPDLLPTIIAWLDRQNK